MGFLTEKNAAVRAALAGSPPDAEALRLRVASRPPPRGFEAALRRDPVSVIAEVKHASPSVGAIASTDPGTQAAAYEAAGAAAVSVLTDAEHFGGSLGDLEAAVSATRRVPILRKDFLLEPVQVLEARAHGADAVLLIAASLDDDALGRMLDAAHALDLGVLLETHSALDLERALATPATVIGVNARDLETLEVDVDRALGLLAEVPDDRVAVLESGVSQRQHVVVARTAGATAVLVGEALMRAADPAAKIDELRGGGR